MGRISNILQINEHRPFPIPQRPWIFYQEWHDVIFAHWKVPLEPLRELIPNGLVVDLFGGQAWVSLVAFSLRGLRPRLLPAFSPLSDFYEINMRTYVVRNNKPGIYFFSLEAEKRAPALIAKMATGLPYMKSTVNYRDGYVESSNQKNGFYLRIHYTKGNQLPTKTTLDRWLTERYCLFLERRGAIVGNDIHHPEWPLKNVEIETLDLFYRYKDLIIDQKADLYHFSDVQQVPTWGQVLQ